MQSRLLRRKGVSAAGLAVLMAGTLVGVASPAVASPNAAVTSTSIRIGLPYIDLSSLGAVGIKLNQGSYPDAYNALVANINAHGGINGRKLSVLFGSVNPTNTTSSLAVCTQLTEDTPVFLAMSPYMPSCYLVDHATPTINATLPSAVPKSAAQNFTLTPPPTAYDPLQLSVFAKMGLLKGKTVGIIGAKQNDVQEVGVVQSTLKELHVKVAQVGITTAQPSDQAALDQQVTAFVQKFQSAGVNEVIAVGSSSGTWPVALTNTQSSYNPPWIATSEVTISGTLNSVAPQYLKGMITSTATPTSIQAWTDPLIQQCVTIIKKAYPALTISAPGSATDHSYVAPESACQNLAIFTKIASGAGKNLTVTSFTKAGYGLRNVRFPGSGGLVSFGPGQPYAIGPVYVGKYNSTTKQIDISTKSSTS